jgi:hypothetical protein
VSHALYCLCVSPHLTRAATNAPRSRAQVNPGEVKVLRGRAQHVVYSDGSGSDNPYEKLRIKIEPTRLAVKVDPVEFVPSSPASSHNGSQTGIGDHSAFGAFRGQQGGSQSCSSQGQSPTESPMPPDWRGNGGGLPTMAPLPPHMGTSSGFNANAPAFNHSFGGNPYADGSQSYSQAEVSGAMGSQQRWMGQPAGLYRGPS